MALYHILVLSSIICASVVCNISALLFIRGQNSARNLSLKDKTISILCVTNILLTIPYTIEVHAYAEQYISDTSCQISAFLVCCLTYTSIGYFVELAMERSISTSSLHTGYVDCASSVIWLLIPPIIGFMLGSAPLLGWGKYGKSRANSLYC